MVSLREIYVTTLGHPVLTCFGSTPSGVEIKVDRRTAEAPDIFSAFCEDFEDRLTKVGAWLLASSLATTHRLPESIVNGAADAQTLGTTMGPALLDLIAPMSKFVGQVNVWQTGVTVQGNTVSVSTQQTIKTVNTYAAVRAPLFTLAPVLTRLSASHDLLEQGFRPSRRYIP